MLAKLRSALPIGILAVVMAAPSAFAAEPIVATPPEPTTITLPTLMPGLTVVISTDTNGYLTSVDLLTGEPPVAAPDYIATKVDNRRVRFENSVTGTRVEVKAKDNKLETKVRTAALADIVGTHTWSGPVLGEPTNVTFTVGDAAGVPTLTDITVDPGPAMISEPETETKSDEIETKVKIKFTNDLGQRAELKIEVEVHTTSPDAVLGDDDDSHDSEQASLKIALKTKDEKMSVAAADITTLPTSWAGVLCDGTPVSATWMIGEAGTADEGSITNLVVSPDTAEVEMHGNEAKVRFDKHATLKIELKTKDDGRVEMKLDPKIKCEKGADPTVNTPVDEKPHKDKDKNNDEKPHKGEKQQSDS